MKPLNWGYWIYHPEKKTRTFKAGDPRTADCDVLAMAEDGDQELYDSEVDADVLYVKGDYEGGGTLEVSNDKVFDKLNEAIKKFS